MLLLLEDSNKLSDTVGCIKWVTGKLFILLKLMKIISPTPSLLMGLPLFLGLRILKVKRHKSKIANNVNAEGVNQSVPL